MSPGDFPGRSLVNSQPQRAAAAFKSAVHGCAFALTFADNFGPRHAVAPCRQLDDLRGHAVRLGLRRSRFPLTWRTPLRELRRARPAC